MTQFRDPIKKTNQVYDPTTGTFRDPIQNNQAVYDPTWNSVPSTGNKTPNPIQPAKQTPSQTPKTGGGSSPQTAPSQGEETKQDTPAEVASFDFSKYAYDPSTNEAYINAMAALDKAKGELPQYTGTYEGQLDELYQQIVGRNPFQYNLNEDMFYQQAADRFQNMGQMAMMDTMGQAAALTGGYGNTYAQNVGQQAYQGYLQQLNDNIPQFYQMALDAYNAEGDQMMQQYGMLGDLANREYGMYQDDLANYWQNLNYQQNIADQEYARGYENWYNAQQMGNGIQNQNYDRLVGMMTTMGYKPSPEEIAAAGMNPDQAQAFMDYYQQQNAPSGGGTRNPNPGKITYGDIYAEALNMMEDGEDYTDVATMVMAAGKEGYITPDQKNKILDEAWNSRKK